MSTLFKNGTLNNTAGWIFRLGLVALIFWIKGNFVSLERYENDRGKQLDALISTGKSMQHLDDSFNNFQIQMKDIEDLKKRVHDLEIENAHGKR